MLAERYHFFFPDDRRDAHRETIPPEDHLCSRGERHCPLSVSLFGKDQVKPLRPSQGDVAYMEIELERSLMKKIPVDGQICNETASNAKIKLSKCLDSFLMTELGCQFPWGGKNETGNAGCEDDKFGEFSEALGWRYFWTVEDVFKTPCRPSCVTNNYRLTTTLEKTAKCEKSDLCTRYGIRLNFTKLGRRLAFPASNALPHLSNFG